MRIATPAGPAVVELDQPDAPMFLLALTHGAGGGIDAPDLLAVRDAALALGGAVARVLQPYRVAGRRMPGAAAAQDAAWLAVLAALRPEGGARPRLVVGGRSNGARVACRTARAAGAAAVLALAFPLRPPWAPDRSRADELDAAAGLPVLVVAGGRDPFGVPAPGPGRQVRVLEGEGHELARDPATVGQVVADWLVASGLVAATTR